MERVSEALPLPVIVQGGRPLRSVLDVDVYVSLMTEETLTLAQLKRELQRIAWGQVRLAQTSAVGSNFMSGGTCKRSCTHTARGMGNAFAVVFAGRRGT